MSAPLDGSGGSDGVDLPQGFETENRAVETLQSVSVDWTQIFAAALVGSLTALLGLISGQVWFAAGLAVGFGVLAAVAVWQAHRHAPERRRLAWMNSVAAHDAALRLAEQRRQDATLRQMQTILDSLTQAAELTGRATTPATINEELGLEVVVDDPAAVEEAPQGEPEHTSIWD